MNPADDNPTLLIAILNEMIAKWSPGDDKKEILELVDRLEMRSAINIPVLPFNQLLCGVERATCARQMRDTIQP